MVMDLKHSHSVKLSDEHVMPLLGLGTAAPEEVPKSKAREAPKVAIDVGYRHVDAAYVYQNEEEVVQALREKIADGTVKREDLFYTTKLWATFFRPELVRPALERSLKKLQLDYVDLFLIHVPVAMKVECHPYLHQSKLLEFCKSKDIVLVAYSALGTQRDPKWVPEDSPHLLEDPVMKEIAKKHSRNPGQVTLCYKLQWEVVVLAKRFREKRIKGNLQCLQLCPEHTENVLCITLGIHCLKNIDDKRKLSIVTYQEARADSEDYIGMCVQKVQRDDNHAPPSDHLPQTRPSNRTALQC
ncbi:Aldo-Keto Reductase Family 1 Member C1 [Manis pentadactyla]|nr:Aldo-Keto Reductase Family 1 Member C1 [Manis pentadactyla]